GGVVTAVMIFLIYYNLLGTSKIWVEQGVIPPVIGLWWVHLVFSVLVFVLLNTNRLVCSLRRRK
ncbi:MAG: LptF/LptG family permease, partial [Gammaproteobacteria bacterium]|nr:LptF/LptG family permease [Gammaproteobacteria bacterium]